MMSYNRLPWKYRMVWVGRDLQNISNPTPLPWEGTHISESVLVLPEALPEISGGLNTRSCQVPLQLSGHWLGKVPKTTYLPLGTKYSSVLSQEPVQYFPEHLTSASLCPSSLPKLFALPSRDSKVYDVSLYPQQQGHMQDR